MNIIDKKYQTKNISSWINTCEYIVLHHTWSIGKGNLPVLLWERATKVSAHYLIDQDWTIIQLAEDKQITWHAWESKRDWKTNLNKYSIGIEIEWPWFTSKQYISVKKLIEFLLKKYNIPTQNIIRHKDIAPNRKTDISDSFRNTKHKTRNEYQQSFNSLPIILMWFYQDLRKKECENIPKEQRIFKDPASACEKIKTLSSGEQTTEILYLIALLLQRIKK